MSGLHDIMRHLFGSFGRPPAASAVRGTDQNVTAIDSRLRSVESEQREIEARLRRLEVQSWREGE